MNNINKIISKYFEKRILMKDLMFLSLCRFFEISKKEGLKKASANKKSPTPIHEYLKNLEDFSEENVIRGWRCDRYRALRNWYVHRNNDYQWLLDVMNINENDRILDYGCSVSFFAYYCLKNNLKTNITLADIE